MIRVESHALGPRCFVAGLRVHEWHLGLATLVAALTAVAMDAPALLASALALTGAWLVAKDWHDLVPSRRDTAACGLASTALRPRCGVPTAASPCPRPPAGSRERWERST